MFRMVSGPYYIRLTRDAILARDIRVDQEFSFPTEVQLKSRVGKGFFGGGGIVSDYGLAFTAIQNTLKIMNRKTSPFAIVRPLVVLQISELVDAPLGDNDRLILDKLFAESGVREFLILRGQEILSNKEIERRLESGSEEYFEPPFPSQNRSQ